MDRRGFLSALTVLGAGLWVEVSWAARSHRVVMAVGGAGAKILAALPRGESVDHWTWDVHAGIRVPALHVRVPIARRPDRVIGAAGWMERALGDLPVSVRRVAVVAGLGGATGSRVVPSLVQELSRRGIGTRAICSLPFRFEGTDRVHSAASAASALCANGADFRVFPNDDLLRGSAGRSLASVLTAADHRLAEHIHEFLQPG